LFHFRLLQSLDEFRIVLADYFLRRTLYRQQPPSVKRLRVSS
jgi:hypothetical protein